MATRIWVVGTATSAEGAGAITAYLREGGLSGCGMVLDVADEAAVVQVVKDIAREFGDPLVLVNNAGITRDNILMRMKAEDWDAVIATNLTAVYRLSKACAPALRCHLGNLIFRPNGMSQDVSCHSHIGYGTALSRR